MALDLSQKPCGPCGPKPEMTLYSLTLSPVARQFAQVCREQEVVPAHLLLDIYMKVAEEGDITALKHEISNLKVFMKMLYVRPLKDKLYKLFQTVVNRDVKQAVVTELFLKKNEDEDENEPPCYRHLVLDLLPARLAANFEAQAMQDMQNENLRENLMRLGTELGEFLCEAGWYEEASKVLTPCMYACLAENELHGLKRTIKCVEKLLGAQICYCMYSQARRTFETASLIIKKLKEANVTVNLAGIYSVFSGLCYLECNYNEALEWSVKALEELKHGVNSYEPKATIDILRQSAKACVVKREFHKAELLIKEAVYLSRDIYGSKSVKYADALLDFGYYLLNRDSVQQAVIVYRECLQIRKAAYGRYNLMTAIVLEDLSYALYVKEYSTGSFDEARSLTQKAINIMDVLLQSNHLQLASVRRVKALILEEIAIDRAPTQDNQLLEEAEKLHLQALNLSKQVFGEMNVQIAKHYGNLGRLYQSMKKYEDAEAMHLKAISIKETLLGLYDYEVALSVGHLASLYNYDMLLYRKAEVLHLRSISIGKRLFGDAYSGLEYDYRGLLEIYTYDGNQDKLNEYSRIYTQWRMLRDLKAATCNENAISDKQQSLPVSEVIKDFFTMNWVNVDSTKVTH